jgi:hypothetical protein
LVTLIFGMEIGPYLESACLGNGAVPVRPYSIAAISVEGEWQCRSVPRNRS